MEGRKDLGAEMELVRAELDAIEREVGKVVVGQREVVRGIITALFADGHVMLEGLPGLGKTLLVKTFKDILQLNYSRVQFTPDLMPADITGTNIIDGTGGVKAFRFEPGPIFTNLLLADEINRASPKTQSALLQAMQEHEVTIFGIHYPLEEPFHAIATQNPIEMAGTYPLPEAQLDRFLFKIIIRPPDLQELVEIAGRTTGPDGQAAGRVMDRARFQEIKALVRRLPVAGPVMDFAARLVLATHPERPEAPDVTRRFVRYGASPRGLQALIGSSKVTAAWDGRFNVSREDILHNLHPALRHRIILNFEGDLQRVGVDNLLRDIARHLEG